MSRPRVYLAGPWVERDKMPAIATMFEQAGWEITHKWWEHETEESAKQIPGNAYGEQCATSDYRGVSSADVVVVLNTVKSEGKAVETGMAIAWGIPLCLIGKNPLNIFYNFSWITKVDTPEEALAWARDEVEVGETA